jgi:hypothetical protein
MTLRRKTAQGFRLKSTIAFLVALGCLLAAGCQQSNSVNGTVTYNGEPVEEGAISFRSADGSGPGFGASIVDGKYQSDKSRPGPHVVSIRGVNNEVVPQSTEEAIRQYEEAKAAGKATLDHYGKPADYIPETAEGNNQTIEIEGGAQTLNFDLKGPPRSQ